MPSTGVGRRGRHARGEVFGRTALLIGLVVSGSCASLGRQAGPSLPFDPDADRRAITYRQISRDDFRADRPPARLLAHASALGAVICARIRATPDSRFHTKRTHRRDGTPVWTAVVDRLRFRAEMERDCSWWNPRVPAHDAARILDHEQLHFALFEIAARHLNQRTFGLVTAFRFTAATQIEAEEAAIDYVRELESLAVDELQTRNRAYDRETAYGSLGHRQREWSAAVQRELLETARYAAVSDPPWPPLDGPPAQTGPR